MQEQELIAEIVTIGRSADELDSALRRMQALLATEFGDALLAVRPAVEPATLHNSPAIKAFLESRDFPVRSLFTSALPGRKGRKSGMLLACVGSWDAPSDMLRRITNCIAEQIGDLALRSSPRSARFIEAA